MLTDDGRAALDTAQVLVDGVERRMLSDLTQRDRDALALGLAACVTALAD
jgi:hypothetical protein